MPNGHPAPVLNSTPFGTVNVGEGTVPSALSGGRVNLFTDRSQEEATPWAQPPGPGLAKLTHFRASGQGDPMWSGRCVYDLAGENPSFSEYDDPDFYANDDALTYSITGGVVKAGDRLAVGEPTTTRRSRVAAHRDSAPAARFFQGFANLHWSGLMAGFRPQIAPRPLTQNFNPNQSGSKEMSRATEYQPYPPMGSIVGFYGEQKAV